MYKYIYKYDLLGEWAGNPIIYIDVGWWLILVVQPILLKSSSDLILSNRKHPSKPRHGNHQ